MSKILSNQSDFCFPLPQIFVMNLRQRAMKKSLKIGLNIFQIKEKKSDP